MDLWLTSDRGPRINQSESAKSFIFKIHHDSCWCCYLILWGVIKRVIFCLGWTTEVIRGFGQNPRTGDVLLKTHYVVNSFT